MKLGFHVWSCVCGVGVQGVGERVRGVGCWVGGSGRGVQGVRFHARRSVKGVRSRVFRVLIQGVGGMAYGVRCRVGCREYGVGCGVWDVGSMV